MKPLTSEVRRLSHCPCCQSNYSKHNAKGSKHAKRNIKKETDYA